MSFMNAVQDTLNNEMNISITENGAVGYRTTGKELLDMDFSVSSMRNWNEMKIADKFAKVFYENKMLAMKWLFYVRDAREGVGERRLFRVCMDYLANNHPHIVKEVLFLVPEYGRWDDLLVLLDTDLKQDAIQIIKNQLELDVKNMDDNQPISLLAKWLPSTFSKNATKKRWVRILLQELHIGKVAYRKKLSALRRYLKVVEIYMSEGRWDEIDYAAVPSCANIRYKSAFMKHDEERRKEYLTSLQKGETKINASVLFPHNVVNDYVLSYRGVKSYDETLEELWKALPDYVNGNANTLCVTDGSGSMTQTVDMSSRLTALTVANALTIYFAEKCSGEFKNKYITFSRRPQFVDLGRGANLKEKIEIAFRHNEVADTNVEAVFDLILTTAVKNNMSQNELPTNILILSDMEFNSCAVANNGGYLNARLFTNIACKYAEHGYKLPRLIFWNICGRTNTIPVKENELGVALLSGFSASRVKMVLSNKLDPFECLMEQLDAERYQPVEEALKDVIV